MTGETWRAVECIDGYEVSSLGQVRRAKPMKGTRVGKILAAQTSARGYPVVAMYSGGIGKSAYVHRLVAQAFIPNPDGLPQVNHIDGDKSNNAAANLEWCSNSQNHAHAVRAGRLAQKLDPERVRQIRSLCERSGRIHADIAAEFGISKSTVQGIASGRIWKHVA